jgi:hypothetical protein
LVEGKYYFAGGSARWMFGYKLDSVKLDVNNYLSQCGSKENILKGISYGLMDIQYNHLRGQFCNKDSDSHKKIYTVISRYVLDEIYDSISNEEMGGFFIQAYSMSKGNMSFKGWIMELDFTHQLKLKADSKEEEFMEFTCGDESVKIPVKLNRIFDNKIKEFVPHSPTFSQLGSWTMFKNHMEPAMDGFVIVDMKESIGVGILLFNLTCGAKHDLKLEYVRSFLVYIQDELKFSPDWIEFAFILPEDGVDFSVSLSLTSGSLSDKKIGTRSGKTKPTWKRWDIINNEKKDFHGGAENEEISKLIWKTSEK